MRLASSPTASTLSPLTATTEGLAQDDALSLTLTSGIGCAQVNANVIGEQFDNFLKER